ncbi:hypothetical protein ACP4OV_028564 [Aristida adscensionis]
MWGAAPLLSDIGSVLSAAPIRSSPRRPAAMDSGTGTSGKTFDEVPPCSWDEEAPRRRPRTAMGSDGDADGVVFDERLQESQNPPWAGVHPDILGVVLRLLPSLADRASVRAVCRQWHAAGRGHVLPPPLPLLVLPEFRFSCLSPKGALTQVRRVPVPKRVGADDIRCVGSFGGWLVGVTPSKKRSDGYYRDADSECFLVNVFSHEVIGLPQLSDSCNFSYTLKSLRVINGSGEVHFKNHGYTMSFCQVVLSASPNSGSKYIVAASSDHKGATELALWQPGMMSWHLCCGVEIDGPQDLAFYQGKLYVLRRMLARLFTLDLEEDDWGVMVSRVEHCMIEQPHHDPGQFSDGIRMYCNMVVWRGKLVLIIRYYDIYERRRTAHKVEVVALDFSINPYGCTKIDSFDGDCIFVGTDGCKSFPAGLHDGVEGDLIYFLPDHYYPYDRFVYSMRDDKMRPFAAQLLSCNYGIPEDYLDFPVWLFPSE